MSFRLPAGAIFCSSSTLHGYRPLRISGEVSSPHITYHRLFGRSGCNLSWKRFQRLNGGSYSRSLIKNRIRATAGYLSSASDPIKKNSGSGYHPLEEISKSTSGSGEDAKLTAAEATRTIIEVNNKAALMFTGSIDDEVSQNLFWPDFPYVTDEHGNIYFQVKNDEDILQSLTPESSYLQVTVGVDTFEMIKETGLSHPSGFDFGMEDIKDGYEDDDIDDEDEDVDEEDDDDDDDDDIDDDDDDDDDEDWVAFLEDENNHNDSDDNDLGDWAKLETMRFSHPLYFARAIAEVTSDDPVDWIEQRPAGLSIHGLLRPALTDEQSGIRKHISTYQSQIADSDINGKIVESIDTINGHIHEAVSSEYTSTASKGSENDEILKNQTSFYKLEMIKILLIRSDRRQVYVDLEDYKRARPDVIAHAASNIISRFNAGGENNLQALRSLCWRCKDIQVEEATLISVDSLGFDARVCSGTQVQTLRFSFNTRATSEYSAERQLNDLLFPRIHQKPQIQKQPHQNEL